MHFQVLRSKRFGTILTFFTFVNPGVDMRPQSLLRGESSLTNVTKHPLLFLVVVRPSQMVFQGQFQLESVSAHVATVGRFVGVRSPMRHQVGAFGEVFAAVFAFVGTQFFMDTIYVTF